MSKYIILTTEDFDYIRDEYAVYELEGIGKKIKIIDS